MSGYLGHRRATLCWGTALILLLFLASRAPHPLAAQIPGDTALTDTLPQDTVDNSARYLEARERVVMLTYVLPELGLIGPRPATSRMVFNRDSIEWGHATTVGDLLAQVPGVYLWRGGWYGRPEPVNYQARGVTSAEYYLDGLPYLPIGVDSVGVDPALFSLSFLDRIEVEQLPGRLRVFLFTRRHDRLAPRSRIAISSGDADFARYEGELERRFPSGFGFALAGDYLNSPTVVARNSRYSNTHVWVQGSYLRSPRFGLQYQIVRSAPNRRPFVIADAAGASDTIGRGFDASRTDAQLRFSFRSREDGLGPGVDLLYGRTSWGGGGVDQGITQLGGRFMFRQPMLAVGGSAFYRSRWTPLDARVSLGWSPTGPFTASVEGAFQAHDGDRSSRWVLLQAGLSPVRGLTLAGSARLGREVAAPSVPTDPAQELRDFRAALGWNRGRLGLEVAYARTSAFAPVAPAEFLDVPGIGPVPATDWVTVSARVAPVRWITLETWYSDPIGAPREGVPPTHAFSSVTLRSKFLRTFRSGVFDLKLQLGMESWGTGVIGRDAAGAPIPLPGATFFRSLIQLQLDRFSFYWDRVNLTATDRTYVPGFRIPQYGTTFGVRWEFFN